MKQKSPLVVVTGPTASGKSSVGVKLAKEFNGEIISADSMQIYKHMNIGTNTVTMEEQQGIPHHLLNIKEPCEEFSVAEYVTLANETIVDIHSRGKIPFLVGGTTLYIQSILDNIKFFKLSSDLQLRKQLEHFAKTNGNNALWEKLNQIDPMLARNLHFNNSGRIIRGIEVYALSGKTLSFWQEESRKEESPYRHLLIGLNYKDRGQLYDNINIRVDQMISNGLLEEITHLKDLKISKTAHQAIGYKELWETVENRDLLCESIELLKKETRRYAKRQLTWMRGRTEMNWIYKDSGDKNDYCIYEGLTLVKRFLQNDQEVCD